MATAAPQRVYRAPCPGCGAPVDFRSAQSTHAVCSFCHSTVVRSGETLQRIGRMAELFQDYSPLQLMAAGRWGAHGFTIVGRLQYKSAEGVWSEWHAALDDGTSAFLAEDNGSYVFAREMALPIAVPPADALRVGAATAIDGKSYSVAFRGAVTLLAAEGELAHFRETGLPFELAELRSEDGFVLSLEYDSVPPAVSRGEPVALEALQLTGLREASEKDEAARQFSCPNCGAPVEVRLADSKTITCPSCHSIIDLSAGIGGELRHALQDDPVQPLIPLGSTGTLQGTAWQIVGFQHRLGQEPDDDERFGWSEYLLYNRQKGFSFLVDATDGWSLVKPATGAPKAKDGDDKVSYLGTTYKLESRYRAETIYVAGEFYWPVARGDLTNNADYDSGRSLLSRESSRNEVTWSIGSRIDSAAVAAAFPLPDDKKNLLKRSDAKPTSGIGCTAVVVILVILIILVLLLSRCSACDPTRQNCGSSSSSSRTSGGSWGGASSGGGHK
ncbi:MAG: DUF4178 domain-containing protein [Pseudomonadota bacterium]